MNSQSDLAELGKLALRSARSVFLIDLLQKISGPLLTVILAWFLTPEEFGILGIAGLILAFAVIFQHGGIADAIIRQRERDDSIYVGFWLSVSIGAALYLLVWLMAPVASQLFLQPQSIMVIRVLSLQLVISSFGTIPSALLKRNFEFNKLLMSQFYAAIVSALVSISFAIYGFGYWAVVIGMLTSNLLFVLLVWWQSHYVPKLVFSFSNSLTLLRFGGFVVLESFLGWFLVYFDNAVVGASLGTAALGIYSLAFNLTNSAIGLPVGALAGVSLATFSRLQNDHDALRNLYVNGTKLVATYCIPAGIGLALLSEPVAQVLFSEKWPGIGPLMYVLALYAGFAHIWILNSHVFKSLGRPDLMMQIYVPMLILIIPVFLISVNFGVLPFAIMRSIAVILCGGVLHTLYAARLLNLNWTYIWDCCHSPLLASLLLAACLGGLNQISWNGSLLLSLVWRFVLGLGAYLLGLFVVDRTFFLTLFSGMVKKKSETYS